MPYTLVKFWVFYKHRFEPIMALYKGEVIGKITTLQTPLHRLFSLDVHPPWGNELLF